MTIFPSSAVNALRAIMLREAMEAAGVDGLLLYGNNWHAGYALRPGWGVGIILVVVGYDTRTTEATVQAVIRAEQIEDRCDRGGAVLQRDVTHRNVPCHDIGVLGRDETVGRGAAEIGKFHLANQYV